MSLDSRVAIVGAGHAGGRVAQHLRALGHRGPLSLIGAEVHAPYERPALSKELLLGQKTAAELTLAPDQFWDPQAMREAGIERIHARAQQLQVDARRLLLDDGRALDFDTLVLATGGDARRLKIPGAERAGVRYLRTLDDSLALKEALANCRGLAVIGAGVIGMEVAASAASLGVPVTVLEAGEHVMARCLPPIVSDWLAALHRARGVRLETGVTLERISEGSELRLCVEAERGGAALRIEADCVLVAIGIDCAPAFLTESGLADQHGVHVDAYCRTVRLPWCYAAGDVANTFSTDYEAPLRQETWRNAENQARAVAEFILGRSEPYRETPWMWSDQLGHNIQVVGMPHAHDAFTVRGELGSGPATVVATREGRVTGGVMVNQGRERRHLENLARNRTQVDLERLADASVSLKELAS